MSRRAFVAVLVWAAACVPPSPARPSDPSSGRAAAGLDDDVPPSNPIYASEATPEPLIGGPLSTAVEHQLLDALRPVGMTPVGDGKLALVAQWAARHLVRGVTPDLSTLDAITRRVGYVGPTPWSTSFPKKGDTQAPIGADDLKRAVDSLPTNLPITRYGIATIAVGDKAQIAIAMGSMEVALQPVPKQVAVNGQLHLAGTLADRFDHGRLAITMPGGKVRSWDSKARVVAGDWVATTAGVHQIELLGDGRSGPVVVANFPVYVGVDEPQPTLPGAPTGDATESGPVDARAVEASVLALLNKARAMAHLDPVAADDALAALSRGHCADMMEHGFFGHVSPTHGTTEDRLRAAHLLYPSIGENVARADSAQHAVDSLMDSPAHRDVMLGAEFTHVGIGAAVTSGVGRPDVYVTLEFASEHPVALDDVPRYVLQATDMARMPHLLPRLQLETGLTEAARQAIGVLTSDPTAVDRALEATRGAAARVRTPTPATCIVIMHSADVMHLDTPLATQDVGAIRLGVAAMGEPEGPESFTIVLVVQAGPNTRLTCK